MVSSVLWFHYSTRANAEDSLPPLPILSRPGIIPSVSGRLAQRKSASFTRKKSQVRSLCRPPLGKKTAFLEGFPAGKRLFYYFSSGITKVPGTRSLTVPVKEDLAPGPTFEAKGGPATSESGEPPGVAGPFSLLWPVFEFLPLMPGRSQSPARIVCSRPLPTPMSTTGVPHFSSMNLT